MKVPRDIESFFRTSAALAINFFGRDILLILLPVHLAQTEDIMDFVLNAVAAFFILDIDDMKEPTKLSYKLKRRPGWKDNDTKTNLNSDTEQKNNSESCTDGPMSLNPKAGYQEIPENKEDDRPPIFSF